MPKTPAETLKALHRQVRDGQPEPLRVRLHRAISWLARAEREAEDPDARFLFLWVALNAAYARDIGLGDTERDRLREFFGRLVAVDTAGRLYGALFGQFTGPVRTLVENRHVFPPFWAAQRTRDPGEAWKESFERSRQLALKALMGKDTTTVMSIVFDRLYVLRNQLVHGGATWNGQVNRQQVRDGAAILASLLPILLELMIAHPGQDHGDILYPVVA